MRNNYTISEVGNEDDSQETLVISGGVGEVAGGHSAGVAGPAASATSGAATAVASRVSTLLAAPTSTDIIMKIQEQAVSTCLSKKQLESLQLIAAVEPEMRKFKQHSVPSQMADSVHARLYAVKFVSGDTAICDLLIDWTISGALSCLADVILFVGEYNKRSSPLQYSGHIPGMQNAELEVLANNFFKILSPIIKYRQALEVRKSRDLILQRLGKKSPENQSCWALVDALVFARETFSPPRELRDTIFDRNDLYGTNRAALEQLKPETPVGILDLTFSLNGSSCHYVTWCVLEGDDVATIEQSARHFCRSVTNGRVGCNNYVDQIIKDGASCTFEIYDEPVAFIDMSPLWLPIRVEVTVKDLGCRFPYGLNTSDVPHWFNYSRHRVAGYTEFLTLHAGWKAACRQVEAAASAVLASSNVAPLEGANTNFLIFGQRWIRATEDRRDSCESVLPILLRQIQILFEKHNMHLVKSLTNAKENEVQERKNLFDGITQSIGTTVANFGVNDSSVKILQDLQYSLQLEMCDSLHVARALRLVVPQFNFSAVPSEDYFKSLIILCIAVDKEATTGGADADGEDGDPLLLQLPREKGKKAQKYNYPCRKTIESAKRSRYRDALRKYTNNNIPHAVSTIINSAADTLLHFAK